MPLDIHPEAIHALASGEIGAPGSILGRHLHGDSVSIRTFRPWAERIDVVDDQSGSRATLRKLHDDGFFLVELDDSWSSASLSF